MITKEQVKQVMEEVDALDLADSAHWALVHERLGLVNGEVFGIIAEHPEFFGVKGVLNERQSNGWPGLPEVEKKNAACMGYCVRCDNCRWVCETHNERPFLGRFACDCGGAGAPCPTCNKTDPDDPAEIPAMPPGFVIAES